VPNYYSFVLKRHHTVTDMLLNPGLSTRT